LALTVERARVFTPVAQLVSPDDRSCLTEPRQRPLALDASAASAFAGRGAPASLATRSEPSSLAAPHATLRTSVGGGAAVG
ncbi:MAG: hypothetical protein RL033_4535, partial [Pseudomonadota bacterium]